MRLTLFTAEKTCEFTLPNQVSGSYSFGDDPNEEQKILDIEAVDNQWLIYAKDGLTIIYDNQYLNELVLSPNEIYAFQKNNKAYFLLTTPSYEEGTKIFLYDQNISLSIGSTNEASIFYPNPYVDGVSAQIRMINSQLVLYNGQNSIMYLNNERVNETEVPIKIGSTLNVLGLRIMFLQNVFMINNPYKGVTINASSSYIQEFNYVPEKYENIEVKDIDLYDKKQYFSKSPRIRRIIEEKEIKIDKPPNNNQEDEMPVILTAGPMLTMGAMSGMNLINTVSKISSGAQTWSESWPTVVTGCLMLTTSLLWPFLTKAYNKHAKRDKRREVVQIYSNYLTMKENELKKEKILQKNILDENLITPIDCLKIINTRKNNFWCKRVEQSDFLTARIGIGNIPLKVNVSWPEEGFEIEQDDLKVMAENLIEKYKYIEDSPLEYSFYENFLTAIMGIEKKCYGLTHNVLLQLMTFYCYDELKIIVFTNEEKAQKWDYLKYSNYCFNTEKSVRFFATNIDEAKELSSYLMQELNFKIQVTEGGTKPLPNPKPYYLIICDSYSMYKKIDFFKVLLEVDNNIGYSTIIIENKLDKLPSKCINFINLNEGSSGVLKNSYENAEITNFHDEIDYSINMMEITKILANIPIEIETAGGKLPEAIEFLEMEKVGKVEQLNILNRWKTNDSTKSLKTEVGVDEENNLMYLDLHEKFHGPHGLVAGTTGSGKSEFIITYILSLSMNYSPDDVAFILIDYKGGGLAYAFENKLTGVKLPHLAGTITNLDKSEMNRTLVSIDSEVKRRQAEFNKARDMLGESTIDIYKYQRFYHEGKLTEPIPHLFIISDEFAELKSQQPEFMDNLISVARIGRSLGVHLILATQKPSGVVNDQIWSNTKFRVCLKVADASDSNEMLKKPDAALLKQSGRFYLQVGMDEIYALGQSGWAGAKYFPSDKIHTKVDKSIDFIDNMGQIIKTIQESSGQAAKEAQGEQLAAVMGEIIKVAGQVNKYAKKLWLDNVPPIVLHDQVELKYGIKHTPYHVTATIGEYDAPELQTQGPVTYNLLEDENLLICGTDGAEREQLLNSLIYSICKNHTSDEVNIYTIDYGSESLRMFMSLPHVGGMVFAGEMEKYTNLLKIINNETNKRKKLFVDYGGDYQNYIKNSGQKLPLKVIIINNYDTLKEDIESAYDEMPELLRDSSRYGIIYIITANSLNATGSRLIQNIKTNIALRLKDGFEYSEVLGGKTKQVPQETPGRGMINNGGIHEFQTNSLTEDEASLSKFVIDFVNAEKAKNQNKAPKIPTLPEHVRLEDIMDDIKDLKSVPYGIKKKNLEVVKVDLQVNVGNLVLANKISNTKKFAQSLVNMFKHMKVGTILIDTIGDLISEKSNVSNYFNENFDDVVSKIDEFIDKVIATPSQNDIVLCIYGIDKLRSKLDDVKKLEDLFAKLKKHEKIPVIVFEENNKIKNYSFDNWYKNLFTSPDGLWIGTGAGDQSTLKISGYNKETSQEIPNDMGFFITEGIATLCKCLDFVTQDGEEDEQ